MRPIWYYFINTPVDLLPWTPFVLLRRFFSLSAIGNDFRIYIVTGSVPYRRNASLSFWLSLAGTKEACTYYRFSIGCFVGGFPGPPSAEQHRLERINWNAVGKVF